MTQQGSVRPPNRNYLWANTIVEELARSGLRAVCIAPGSRSTPLAFAFAQYAEQFSELKVYSLIDERSAGFFALGIAQATLRPVALVCSSGTATANFYPAMIEAKYAGVPLLVLTADRPPELRESGANQTIDQVKMFSTHALWSVDMPLPEADPALLTIRNIRALACRAYALAEGMNGTMPRGAVHLNVPFRKPLEPVPVESDNTNDAEFAGRADGKPYVRFDHSRLNMGESSFRQFNQWMTSAERPLIIAGPDVHQRARDIGVRLSSRFPVLADPLSGARFHKHQEAEETTALIGGYDTFLKAAESIGYPDVVLHIGHMPTSQTLIDYLSAKGDARHILIGDNGTYRDSNHMTSDFIHIDSAHLVYSLGFTKYSAQPRPQEAAARTWQERFQRAEEITWAVMAQEMDGSGSYFDGEVVADIFNLVPDRCALFLGNSLPVRHTDQFARPLKKSLGIFGNRGASGIDGNVSTALGIATLAQPLVAILGDLTFYHDMNGLMATRRTGTNAVFVVINNDGGGIFQRLPIAGYEPYYTDLFRTPHGLTFEHAAALYGLEYANPPDRRIFKTEFEAALARLPAQSTLIEVQTDAVRDLERRNAITARVVEAIRKEFANS